MKSHARLGVNIDHVATIRNARGGEHPEPLRAALLAVKAGADGITAHLREDRRHIQDKDIERLKAELTVPLNLEMAASKEMLEIAIRHAPHAVCLVPERRKERTTEGGLDVAAAVEKPGKKGFHTLVQALGGAGIRVSLFVEPEPRQLDAALAAGAPVVELHTGAYCEAAGKKREKELLRLIKAAAHARQIGLECHAGHGLNYDNIGPVAAISSIVEFNIGHFLVGEAIFTGFEASIKRMRALIKGARR